MSTNDLTYNTLTFDSNGGYGYISPIKASTSDVPAGEYQPGEWIVDPDSDGSLPKRLVDEGKSVYVLVTKRNIDPDTGKDLNHGASADLCPNCAKYDYWFINTDGTCSDLDSYMESSGIYYIVYSSVYAAGTQIWPILQSLGEIAGKTVNVDESTFDGKSVVWPFGLLWKNSQTFYVHSNYDIWYVKCDTRCSISQAMPTALEANRSAQHIEEAEKHSTQILGFFKTCEPES